VKPEKRLLQRERAKAMRRFETELWAAGVCRIAGVDEVGIGPMAGPVVAAAVVFPPGTAIDEIDDSKRLEPSVREALEREIRARASAIGLGVVDVPDVDRLNVYHAGLLAMRRAVDSLPVDPEHVLVDARTIPDLAVPQNSLTKGDTLSFSIAAASIVAKVCRDRMMADMDAVYPGYGFRSHKGYCSPAHQDAVGRLGPSPIHRRSFDFIRELTGEYDPAFYELREALARLETRGDLRTWETRFREARSRLSPRGVRKLHALAARRSRRMGWS
jgi:ribonuclease HII